MLSILLTAAAFVAQLASLTCPDGRVCDFLNGGADPDCAIYDEQCEQDGCNIARCHYIVDTRDECFAW